VSKTVYSSSTSAFTEWVIMRGQLGIKTNESVFPLPAADIVRIEYKGQKLFNSIEVARKPSDDLEDFKINRFPTKLSLVLEMPVNRMQKPILKVIISAGKWSVALEELPEYDQLIVGNHWFPLIKDNVRDIRELFQNCNIKGLGIVSLRQALDLILSESDYLAVFESEEAEEDYDARYPFSNTEETLKHAGFTATLYPYQKTGVSWLNSIAGEGLGCILADEMGLGKTVQVIALLTIYKEKWRLPSLIVAPATLLENWRREFLKFSGDMSVLVHIGSRRTGFPSTLMGYDIIVTSYDTAVRDQGMFGMLDWGFIVVDEAQAIKNPDTRRAIAVKSLNRRISISVSGTPVENRLRDLWSIMDFSCPGLLGSRVSFESNYEDTENSANRLEHIVSPLMLRRRVADVADDLPEKIVISQAVNMKEEEVVRYEALRQSIADQYGKSATLVSLIKLRQFCSHPFIIEESQDTNLLIRSDKYVRLTEILEEIVAQKQKVIVFTSFIKMSDLLTGDIPIRFGIPCDQIDGRTPVADRQVIVDCFSTVSGSAMLILNPRAAGTGLNITAANHVIHYNLEWNPAVEEQATARAYRRGQELPVTVHRLFYPDTIEEVIDARINRKRRLADAAVVGTEAAEADAADIAKALIISPAKEGLT
jgi:SNF2 family DNA or RNA helicase